MAFLQEWDTSSLSLRIGGWMGDKAIKDIGYGMVFDHIPMEFGKIVADVLKKRIWTENYVPVYTGEGVKGNGLRKDIVKLDGLQLELGCDALNEIAIIHPDITVNWIEDSQRTQKKHAHECIGSEIHSNRMDCGNVNCIANYEAPGKFKVIEQHPLLVECHYCPTTFHGKYNGK
jgi:aspartate carbamoyltransferase regulatory subunit